MNKLKIGWAEIDITPDKKTYLEGQFAERISEYVEKPITATALAVEAGGEQMVLVSCDLVGTPKILVEAVREKLADNTVGLDPMKTVYSATHIHTGPSFPNGTSLSEKGKGHSEKGILLEALPEGKKYISLADAAGRDDVINPQDYFVFLTDCLAKVTLEAWNKRAEGSYTTAFGRAAVGLNRRAVYTDGSAKMWGDTNTASFYELEGGSDSGIELMYTFGEGGKLTGIIANLACPAQCVQHRLFVSPDFWGEVKVLLRKHFGEDIFLLCQCSNAGDQCPVDLVRWTEPESDLNDPNIYRANPPMRKADPSMFDLAGMRKTGRRIANEIIAVYDDGLDAPIGEAEFKHEIVDMPLPLRKVTPADVKEAKRELREYVQAKVGDFDYNDIGNLNGCLGVLMRERVQEHTEVVHIESHIIRLGNIAFATNPFEAFLVYGNQIKARSRAEQTFIVQLANGVENYLPSEKAEKGGHYSAWAASGTVGHIGGEQMVRQTLEVINNLFE